MMSCSATLLVASLSIALFFLSSPTSADVTRARKLKKAKSRDPTPAPVSTSTETVARTVPKIIKAGPTTSWRIVSESSDLHFVPGMAVVPDEYGEPQEIMSIPGSKLLQNGHVHLVNQVDVQENRLVGTVPDPVEGSFYNQQCTAMDGVETNAGDVHITHNMCEITFCMFEFGCLYLRSGGLFKNIPFDAPTDAVPSVRAIILGGTYGFENARGYATIGVISRSNDNDSGQVVMQFDVVADYLRTK